VLAEFCPRKQRQAKIDGGGIQCVNRLIQLHAKGVVGIKTSGPGNEDLCELCIDSPIPNLVRMYKRGQSRNSGIDLTDPTLTGFVV
jgi:hypothetical protein